MEAIADEIVALQKVRRSVNVPSEICRIDTKEAVGFTSITANTDKLQVLCSHVYQVYGEVGDGIIIDWISLVPVVWEGFIAGRILEVGVVASDGVERFEDVACEEAFGVFGGFVSHESVDEGPSGGLSYNAAEGCVEKVGIVRDRFLKAGSAVVGEYLKVDAIAVLLTKFIQSGKLRELNQIVVTAVSGLTLGT